MERVPANPIIPTGHRAKIANTHGYPLGAEAISAALAGVPQYAMLEVSFWEARPLPIRYVSDLMQYCVLEVGYRRLVGGIGSNPASLLNWHEPNWRIAVYSVPRIRKHLIKNLLLTEALPAMHSWLLNDPMNRIGRHRIAFTFSELTEMLTLEEDSNLEPELAG